MKVYSFPVPLSASNLCKPLSEQEGPVFYFLVPRFIHNLSTLVVEKTASGEENVNK